MYLVGGFESELVGFDFTIGLVSQTTSCITRMYHTNNRIVIIVDNYVPQAYTVYIVTLFHYVYYCDRMCDVFLLWIVSQCCCIRHTDH